MSSKKARVWWPAAARRASRAAASRLSRGKVVARELERPENWHITTHTGTASGARNSPFRPPSPSLRPRNLKRNPACRQRPCGRPTRALHSPRCGYTRQDRGQRHVGSTLAQRRRGHVRHGVCYGGAPDLDRGRSCGPAPAGSHAWPGIGGWGGGLRHLPQVSGGGGLRHLPQAKILFCSQGDAERVTRGEKTNDKLYSDLTLRIYRPRLIATV